MLRLFWPYVFRMQYEHEGVEITYQYSYSKHSQLTVESISENRIITHLVGWSQLVTEFDRIKSAKQ